MYRFTDNNDLSFLIGKELTQICIGKYDLQLNFSPDLNVSIFFKIKIYRKDQPFLDINIQSDCKKIIPLNSLLGESVVDYKIEREVSLMLIFSDNVKLLIDGSYEKLECYTINNKGKLYVI